MEAFYPEIRTVHMSAVAASGFLFLLRGIAMGLGYKWYMASPTRYLSYTIDTILLTAALMLMILLSQYPFVHSWLTVKVICLVVYIILGTFALKRAKSRTGRLGFWLAALIVYSFIISVARTKDPQGLFHFTP